VRRLLRALAGAGAALLSLWSGLALWIDGPSSRWLAGALAVAVPLAAATALWRVRPLPRSALAALLPGAAALAWWLSIPARNDRDWLPDVARAPRGATQGRALLVDNVRAFEYRSETDYDERWTRRRYDLDALRGLDLFVSFWGPTLYAHTILSWDFGDAPPLAVSIETRKEKGESYSALLGFFRQYELVYVAADERDVVGLRTSHRGERVLLYRLATPKEAARALLLEYVAEMNQLVARPAWYNAATHNCTTSIWHNVRAISPGNPFDWRLLANGRLDELAYERGLLDMSLPLSELRRRGDVTERAKACGTGPDFSRCIREGVPLPAARRGTGQELRRAEARP
jgi:hypothetical protein